MQYYDFNENCWNLDKSALVADIIKEIGGDIINGNLKNFAGDDISPRSFIKGHIYNKKGKYIDGYVRSASISPADEEKYLELWRQVRCASDEIANKLCDACIEVLKNKGIVVE